MGAAVCLPEERLYNMKVQAMKIQTLLSDLYYFIGGYAKTTAQSITDSHWTLSRSWFLHWRYSMTETFSI
jgi:hypothetical protein